MTGALVAVGLTAFVLCVVVAYVAQARGHSAVGFFALSLLLSPLVGFAVAVALPRREARAEASPVELGAVLAFLAALVVGLAVLVHWAYSP